MRALPAALPGGAQRAKVTGMARSVDAKTTVEAALPPPSSRMPKVRRAGGGLSLGRAVGASDHGSVECGGETGSGVELAGDRPPVRLGLGERGGHCGGGGGGEVGASARGSVEWGGETGWGVEWAGARPPVRLELEERGEHCEAGGAVRVEKPCASAGACHWHRSEERRVGEECRSRWSP